MRRYFMGVERLKVARVAAEDDSMLLVCVLDFDLEFIVDFQFDDVGVVFVAGEEFGCCTDVNVLLRPCSQNENFWSRCV